LNFSDEENKSVIVTDGYLIDMVKALTNLMDGWMIKAPDFILSRSCPRTNRL